LRIVVLHGSPRRGMNSDTLADKFLQGISEKSATEITHFYVNEMNILPCQGCLSCEKPPHKCRIEDDMQKIYNSYKEAEIIVWVTPMYWGYLTSQIKKVQDRMESLAWSGFSDKTFVVLITYRYHFQSAAGMFERIAPYFKINLHIIPCRTYDGNRDVSIYSCVKELEQAYNLGKRLAESPA
jgi:multimeric flavodoxin WrbA